MRGAQDVSLYEYSFLGAKEDQAGLIGFFIHPIGLLLTLSTFDCIRH